eukprot:468372-Prymnesium_polylepis.1
MRLENALPLKATPHFCIIDSTLSRGETSTACYYSTDCYTCPAGEARGDKSVVWAQPHPCPFVCVRAL